MAAHYNTSARYDQGLRYATSPAPTTPRKMTKIKLELQTQDDGDVKDLATTHKNQMAGNANFTTPAPPALVFDAALTAYGDKLNAIAVMEGDLASLRSEKDELRKALEKLLTSRASYVEETSGGVAAIMLSSGFALQAEGTATTSLAQPQNFVATMGDHATEVDLSCHAVKKAKFYVAQCREHIEGQVPGPWTHARTLGTSSMTITGLISGRTYAFRYRAEGPNETVSPWSDEAVCMAP